MTAALDEDDQLVRAAISRWRYRPLLWVQEELGVEPDLWQRDVLIAYGNKDATQLRIAMLACVGPGKTAVLAWIALHFMLFMGHPHEHPQGIALSKTADNLYGNLYKEIAKWRRKSVWASTLLRQNRKRLYHVQYPETWFLDFRTYSKSASREEIGAALSGTHGRYLLYLLDEIGSQPIEVGLAAEQGFAQANAIFQRIIGAGNPISRRGLLFHMAVEQANLANTVVVRITGDPDDPRRSPRIPAEWAREQIEKRGGREHPWVRAHLLGLFPRSEFNALLTVDEVKESMTRRPHPSTYEANPVILGIDVSGGGADRSVIFPRQGWLGHRPIVLYTGSSTVGVARVSELVPRLGVDATFLDGSGGFANGWADRLKELNIRHQRIPFSGKADDAKTHFNKRAEMWWRMREWVLNGGALPDVPDLINELTVPTYEFKGDRIIMEDKDEIRSALGDRSPDIADALSLTFARRVRKAHPVTSKYHYDPNRGRSHAKVDTDPFK